MELYSAFIKLLIKSAGFDKNMKIIQSYVGVVNKMVWRKDG